MAGNADGKKSVAVIGGGQSGIVAVKSCVEAGLTVTCYEKKHSVGGLWNLKEDNCVPFSTITNLSKEYCTFSDFLHEKSTSIYLKPTQLAEYLEKYVDHFNLKDCFKFQHSVTLVKKWKDLEGGISWKVKFKDANGEKGEQIFDFIVICSGYNQKAYIPENLQSISENFIGKVIHSSDYKSWQGLEGKRILVVGLGDSGGDISCELCRFAEQVWLSTEHGAYCWPRLAQKGTPLDVATFKNYNRLIPNSLASRVVRHISKQKLDHKAYGLEPKSTNMTPSLIINDDLPNRICTGQVIIKTSIKNISDRTITFTDDTSIDNIDCIVLCTGFSTDLHYLDNEVTGQISNRFYLPFYKRMFPVGTGGTLGFVGFQRQPGPIYFVIELQARYIAAIFSNKLKLPSDEELQRYINEEFASLVERFGADGVQLREIATMSYCDDLANELGCQPNRLSLWLTDPKLAKHLCFGSWLGYEYRLSGPNSWEGARDAIIDMESRLWYPLQNGKND